MITEDYCSYELAKLLKEKGFDEVCDHYVDNHWDEDGVLLHAPCKTSDLMFGYMCPTHQMAMKWLREVHRKYIDIRYNNQNEKYRFIVFTMVKDKPIDFIHSEFYNTYEETTNAALFYVLENLI